MVVQKKKRDPNDGFPLKEPKTAAAKHRWALAVLRIWREEGHPILIGVGAEQVQTARSFLGLVYGE